MKRVRARLSFLSPWHVSSGRGGGPAVDATIVRNADGLPYVPGRALKGLLRDAMAVAEGIALLPAGTTDRLFGGESQAQQADVDLRYRTELGMLRVDSAVLPEPWGPAARRDPAWAEELVQVVAATALEAGVAKNQTLRTFEVAVPMQLDAVVEGPDDAGWVEALRAAAPFVRAAGAHRHRGYGRLALTIEEVSS